jgi:AcrR family transcriptional regulator
MSPEKRTYRMKQRAESQEATRRRITESAVALHEQLGPSQTSMAAVAEHAGVQRSTLYRHFPDEAALFSACSAHWNAAHPRPDIASWAQIADPAGRLRNGLAETYAWYRSTGMMLDRLLRDEHLVPAVEMRFSRFHEWLDHAHDLLLTGRGLRGARKAEVSGLIRLALQFESWRALCRDGGLDDEEAAELMAGFVAATPGRRTG